MKGSKTVVVINTLLGHLLCIIGYSLGSLTLLALILSSIGAYETAVEYETIVVALLFLTICVALIVMGTRIKGRLNRFKRYVSLMSLQKLDSISDIASYMSKSADFVQKDLQKMISRRFFVNAKIDLNSNKIIICPGTLPGQVGSAGYEVFQCPGCGASGTRVRGVLGYCDYCGSPVQ